MNFTKHIDYKPNKQIWRILISDDDKVIIEKRDVSDKQVYFDSFQLDNKKTVFNDLQLDEKFWIGIEKIYKGVILFHKYPKPDMPGHKEIIAYDIETDTVLWRNEDYVYLFLYDDKVYCFQQQFEGRKYFTLSFKSGEIVDDLGNNSEKVNALYDQSRNEESYSDYIFPETIESKDEKVLSILADLKSNLKLVWDVEYNIYGNCLLASYHTKAFEKSMINKFSAFDLTTSKELLNETLVLNTESFMTDSFFVYKTFLFLLKGKEELLIYKIE